MGNLGEIYGKSRGNLGEIYGKSMGNLYPYANHGAGRCRFLYTTMVS